jgi:hypothetical protein
VQTPGREYSGEAGGACVTDPTLTVALSGTGTSSGGSTNLALNQPITASSPKLPLVG